MQSSDTNFLNIGDKVMWSGSWGSETEKLAEVDSITVVEPNTKYGDNVDWLHWNLVRGRECIINLTNGHWAWGFQVTKLA
tara:strand:- start:1307 stop:1546 length:240 start_codon:yes stop_codon:yes gene_type:complete